MENFEKIECYKCGVLFAISAKLKANFKENREIFYCVNGHGQTYAKSTSDILAEKLRIAESQIGSKDSWINALEKKAEKLERKLKKKVN